MRDKDKKYLMDTYLADLAPNLVRVPPVGPICRHATGPRPLKASRGFLDDTDDADDEEKGNVYKICIVYLYFLFSFFHKYSYMFHLRMVAQRVVGDDDVSISNEESST